MCIRDRHYIVYNHFLGTKVCYYHIPYIKLKILEIKNLSDLKNEKNVTNERTRYSVSIRTVPLSKLLH